MNIRVVTLYLMALPILLAGCGGDKSSGDRSFFHIPKKPESVSKLGLAVPENPNTSGSSPEGFWVITASSTARNQFLPDINSDYLYKERLHRKTGALVRVVDNDGRYILEECASGITLDLSNNDVSLEALQTIYTAGFGYQPIDSAINTEEFEIDLEMEGNRLISGSVKRVASRAHNKQEDKYRMRTNIRAVKISDSVSYDTTLDFSLLQNVVFDSLPQNEGPVTDADGWNCAGSSVTLWEDDTPDYVHFIHRTALKSLQQSWVMEHGIHAFNTYTYIQNSVEEREPQEFEFGLRYFSDYQPGDNLFEGCLFCVQGVVNGSALYDMPENQSEELVSGSIVRITRDGSEAPWDVNRNPESYNEDDFALYMLLFDIDLHYPTAKNR